MNNRPRLVAGDFIFSPGKPPRANAYSLLIVSISGEAFAPGPTRNGPTMPRLRNDRRPVNDISQIAELIAEGQASLPLDLPDDELLELAVAIQQIRRRQFRRWLAGELARSLMTKLKTTRSHDDQRSLQSP